MRAPVTRSCCARAPRGRNEEGHRARRVMEHEFDGIPEKHSASEQTRDGAEHDEIRLIFLSGRENFFPAERETLTCDSTRTPCCSPSVANPVTTRAPMARTFSCRVFSTASVLDNVHSVDVRFHCLG